MDFLYSTPGGAIDAAVTAVICLAVLAIGTARGRLLAAAVLAVYILDRSIMIATSDDLWPVYGAFVEFAAVCGVAAFVPGVLGRAMAALFTLKLAVYVLVIGGWIDFFMMANIATVAVYLQLIVVLAGVANGGHFTRLRPDNRPGPAHRRFVHSLAKRLDAE